MSGAARHVAAAVVMAVVIAAGSALTQTRDTTRVSPRPTTSVPPATTPAGRPTPVRTPPRAPMQPPGALGARPPGPVDHALLGETGTRTGEISTTEMREVLAAGRALVIDTRTFSEFAIGHLPGAHSVAPRPGISVSKSSSDVAEIRRIVSGRKDAPVILYGNGPYDGTSRRLADELVENGFTGVRRYQLGVAVWRALGGVLQIENQGLRHVVQRTEGAVLIDSRDSIRFAARTIPNAINVPRTRVYAAGDSGAVRWARGEGRLPMNDHDTRIVVFGADSTEARTVAEALTREAFHNVSFYAGTFLEALLASGR